MSSEYQTVRVHIRTHDGKYGPADLFVGDVQGLFVLDSRVLTTCPIPLSRDYAPGFLAWLTGTESDEDTLLDPHRAMTSPPPGQGCVVLLDNTARVQVCRLLGDWLGGDRP